MRRVRRPWVQPFPTDRLRTRELVAAMRKQLGAEDAQGRETRQDDDPQLWWDMLTYHAYLLNKARSRGFDHHEGVQLCDLELLALLQHYGVATHLLDISSDVTTALWFASCADSENTGVVIEFDESGIEPLTAEAEIVPLLLTLGIFRSVWDGLVPVAGRVVIVTDDGAAGQFGWPEQRSTAIVGLPRRVVSRLLV
jgi:hypothetical protein